MRFVKNICNFQKTKEKESPHTRKLRTLQKNQKDVKY